MMKKNIIYIILAAGMFLIASQSFAQDDNISPERKKAIDSLALEKVHDLSKYISIIGSKETPFSEAQRVMDRAEELFADNSEIGVSSLSHPDVNYYKVREYFQRLMALNYDKISIRWYNIHYISDLERQPDGKDCFLFRDTLNRYGSLMQIDYLFCDGKAEPAS